MTKTEVHVRLLHLIYQASELEDDAWIAAMTEIRNVAWEGKELIFNKRWAGRLREPLATKPHRVTLDVSTLEDLLNDSPTTVDAADRSSGLW